MNTYKVFYPNGTHMVIRGHSFRYGTDGMLEIFGEDTGRALCVFAVGGWWAIIETKSVEP